MALIMKSAQYVGSDAEYQALKAWLITLAWDPGIHTVFVTNGRHIGHEVRGDALAEVTYFGVCYNVDLPHGGVKLHWYLN